MKIQNNYNPDVLSCIANLSNDEVFTPPKLANEILDLLPKEIWKDKNATFLDPVSKSGVFLREIAKRLLDGLEKEIPNVQKRIDHIYKNQIFGIGITDLTSFLSRRSLYCSKKANGKYSVTNIFDDDEYGNIFFETTKHTWENNRCKYCGASKLEYGREEGLETHAYQFIHNNLPDKIKNMKFDVIIGNPPYQLNDSGGNGSSAIPIYQLFVTQAKKMNPRYLAMIIPSRWFSGGKGLQDFRSEMLNDRRIKNIVDFESATDVFSGVDIAGGVNYFLWDKDYSGDCEVVNFMNGKRVITKRKLNEFGTFVRNGLAVPIIRKIQNKHNGVNLDKKVSARKPFGIASNHVPSKNGIACYFTQKIGKKFVQKSDITDGAGYLNKWKLLIPFAPIAGQTDFSKPIQFYYDGNIILATPGESCSETLLVAGSFNTETETRSFKSYLLTKIVRFLLLQSVVSQNITRQYFNFIPDLGVYNGVYTDKLLRKKWNITDEEWEYINSKIK